MRIIVGVTGASGVQMSLELLHALKAAESCEVHLIVSSGARRTWELECQESVEALYRMADQVYEEQDLAAVIASGSFVTDGMIILPCSMKTLAGIASGYADNLILRAADVCLKEGRKVVLVPREMPLGRIHLRNLKEAADYGCVIVPPMLTFYSGGAATEEQICHVIGKILMQFGLSYSRFRPWKGSEVKNDTITHLFGAQQTAGDCRTEGVYSAGALTAQVSELGEDIHILLQGGERPHIGCTVMAVPRLSLRGNGSGSCTSSVLNVSGHKDEELCRYLAEQVAAAAQRLTVCTGGVHIDQITEDQIQDMREAVKEIALRIIRGGKRGL